MPCGLMSVICTMLTVENYVEKADIRLDLLVQGEVRCLNGTGQCENDPHLGEVLRVRIDDPTGGDPEFVFPLNGIERDHQLDLHLVPAFRLRVDVDLGTVVATTD